MLTCDGISQAASLGTYVSSRQLVSDVAAEVAADTDTAAVDGPISRTYCSPMQRCRQTYAAVSGVCSGHVHLTHDPFDTSTTTSMNASNKPAYHPLPEPIILQSLHEIELCEWQGRLRRDVALNDVENWNVFKSQPTQLRLNNGTFAPVLDCWERAKSNWDVILSQSAQHDDEVVFIMCHGAIGQAMLLHALGLDIELYGKSKRFAFDNCDCFEVEWCDGDIAARRWRRVYPVEGRWEKCSSTQKMYGSELASSR